jgi:hypothetical protein
MQPENSRAPIGPEQLPVAPVPNAERGPTLPTPEAGLETGLERVEQAAEATAAVADASAIAAPTVAPVMPGQTTTGSGATPIVAADEDVIEKEWVDKAKEIINATKDDPHERTAKVNDLQKDYLKKRFGKILGASE